MKWWITLPICLGVLAAGVFISALLIIRLKKEPEKAVAGKEPPAVEVIMATPRREQLNLPTQGMVEAARETLLASEVSGKVIWVAPEFNDGGLFEEGAEMVRVDRSDYEASLEAARAELADAQLNLVNEEALAERSMRDWRRMGQGSPSTLVKRHPHLASAKARIASAKARIAKAERDLIRCSIRAPYAARIDRIETELGSFLSPGAPVARVFSVAPFEVRLPLSLDDFTLTNCEDGGLPRARLSLRAGGDTYEWDAAVVRQEGKVDRASRSVYLVAEVGADGLQEGSLLQPGLFVQAEVEGRLLEEVYRVPLRAFRDDGSILLVTPEWRLMFRQVEVIRREGDDAFVVSGLKPGDRICVTELEAVIEGMRVKQIATNSGL